jgi:hypothetical protein
LDVGSPWCGPRAVFVGFPRAIRQSRSQLQGNRSPATSFRPYLIRPSDPWRDSRVVFPAVPCASIAWSLCVGLPDQEPATSFATEQIEGQDSTGMTGGAQELARRLHPPLSLRFWFCLSAGSSEEEEARAKPLDRNPSRQSPAWWWVCYPSALDGCQLPDTAHTNGICAFKQDARWLRICILYLGTRCGPAFINATSSKNVVIAEPPKAVACSLAGHARCADAFFSRSTSHQRGLYGPLDPSSTSL